MKKIVILCITLILLLTLGCGKAADNTTSTAPGTTTEAQNNENSTTLNTTSELDTTPQITLETSLSIAYLPNVELKESDKGVAQRKEIRGEGDSNRLGVSKTLVCVCYSPFLDIPSAESIAALNELLVNEYGCDFTVEFHIYPFQVNSEYYYFDIICDLIQSGQQIDILTSGNNNWYTKFVNLDIYESLSPYLKSETGTKLWNIYPEESWISTTRNNKIYGIVQSGEVSNRVLTFCKKSVSAKYNITFPNQCSFYDLGTILEEIEPKYGKTIFDNTIPIVSGDAMSPIYMSGYYTDYALGNISYKPSYGGATQRLGNAIYFKKDVNGNWLAVNPAKEADIISLMKQIKKYVDKGWYICNPSTNLTQTNYIFCIADYSNYSQVADKIICQYSDTKTKSTHTEILDVVIGNTTYLPYCTLENNVTGITSCSEYKDEAFKFLSLINTEAKLSNHLMFGIEGKDWEYKNGELYDLTTGSKIITTNTNFATFSNINLIPSTYLDPEDKVAGIKELSAKHEASPLITHNIDVSAYTEKMKTINAIYCAYMGRLLVGEYKDIDGVMAQMNSMLEDAGINEIIDDINRQMQQ